MRPRDVVPWLFQGVHRREDIRANPAAVSGVDGHRYMYQCLGILDAKAQALLAYDGILLAAASIVLTVFSGGATSGTAVIVGALAASGLSSVLCLTVIWVHWTDPEETDTAGDSLTRLLLIRNRRTLGYRLAWTAAQLAAVLLVVGIPLQRGLG